MVDFHAATRQARLREKMVPLKDAVATQKMRCNSIRQWDHFFARNKTRCRHVAWLRHGLRGHVHMVQGLIGIQGLLGVHCHIAVIGSLARAGGI